MSYIYYVLIIVFLVALLSSRQAIDRSKKYITFAPCILGLLGIFALKVTSKGYTLQSSTSEFIGSKGYNAATVLCSQIPFFHFY